MTREKHRRPKCRGRLAGAIQRVQRRKRHIERTIVLLGKIARKLAAMPVLNHFDPDEWLYDERGLPH
jgi:hypothetical protein